MTVIGKNVNDYATSYHGTIDCYIDSGCRHKKITQINGEDLPIAECSNAEDCGEYTTLCSDLKKLLAGIKYCHKTWDLNVREYKREVGTKWMPIAEEFIDHWREEMAPQNITVSIHKAMMNLHH